jgi:Cof subfamily protein (haloacid dehalogenase superfamily)
VAAEPAALDAVPDIRLIAVDMDGTLLDTEHRIDPTFWPLLRELDRRGIAFCPASGRQYANLVRRFDGVVDDVLFIAENGAYVACGRHELSAEVIDAAVVARAVTTMRSLAASGIDAGVVVCGKRSAYVERHDAPFIAECDTYYALLDQVDDLLEVHDEVLKVAVFDFGAAEATTAPALEPFRATHQVVVSGEHWVDVMNATTDKGAAVRQIQESLGITRAQTMAFGDYLNDVEMLAAADYSFAMANAHPTVRAGARYLAPGNDENGVVRTIAAVLGIPMTLLTH